MIDPLYPEAVQSVAEIIEELGQPITQTVCTVGTYNTATLTSTATSSTVARFGALLPLNLRAYPGQTRRPDTDVKIGDQMLLVDGLTAIGIDDLFTLADGRQYSVVSSEPFEPAGMVIFYDLHVRRR